MTGTTAGVRPTPSADVRTALFGERRYFTAVYPDVAVAEACVFCHNTHVDGPRSDFQMGDVMGGVAVRISLGG